MSIELHPCSSGGERGGILLRKGDFALEMTADGAALETVLYMEQDTIREAAIMQRHGQIFTLYTTNRLLSDKFIRSKPQYTILE